MISSYGIDINISWYTLGMSWNIIQFIVTDQKVYPFIPVKFLNGDI
jgi:hypothetical protein